MAVSSSRCWTAVADGNRELDGPEWTLPPTLRDDGAADFDPNPTVERRAQDSHREDRDWAAPRRFEEAYGHDTGVPGDASRRRADDHDLAGGKRDVHLVRVAEQAAQPSQHRPERRVRPRGGRRSAPGMVEGVTDGPCHEQWAECEVPGVADECRRAFALGMFEPTEDRDQRDGGEPGGAQRTRHGRRGPNHRHRAPCGSPGTRRRRRGPSAARRGRRVSRSSWRRLWPSRHAPADRVLVGMEVRDRRPGVQRVDHLRRGPGRRHTERAGGERSVGEPATTDQLRDVIGNRRAQAGA